MTLEEFKAIYSANYLVGAPEVPPRKFEAIKTLNLTEKFELKARDDDKSGARRVVIKSTSTTGDFYIKKIDGKYRFTNIRGE